MTQFESLKTEPPRRDEMCRAAVGVGGEGPRREQAGRASSPCCRSDTQEGREEGRSVGRERLRLPRGLQKLGAGPRERVLEPQLAARGVMQPQEESCTRSLSCSILGGGGLRTVMGTVSSAHTRWWISPQRT